MSGVLSPATQTMNFTRLSFLVYWMDACPSLEAFFAEVAIGGFNLELFETWEQEVKSKLQSMYPSRYVIGAVYIAHTHLIIHAGETLNAKPWRFLIGSN